MSTIQAVVVDPAVPDRLILQAVAPPTPGPSEALVQVAAFSLNLGEIRRTLGAEVGARPGWDLSGTVVQAAADGSGPTQGTRVVGFLPSGAWAEQVAVPTNALAPLPEGVSLAQAATLPVAGLTALYAIERASGLLARSVLVTGASGGVGLFACQLAHLAGARVVGLIRNPAYRALVEASSADEIVISESATAAEEFGPYRLIVESVGSHVYADAINMLAPEGVCVSLGISAGNEATCNIRPFMVTGGATIYGFYLFNELQRESAASGLQRLLSLVADKRLQPQITTEAPWEEIGTVARNLWERRIGGKAVLHIGSSGSA